MTVVRVIRMIADAVIDLIYPPRCLLCNGIIPLTKKRWLCTVCRQKLQYTGSLVCSVCGKTLSAQAERCGDCRSAKHMFIKNRAVILYDDNAKYLIYRFKYGKNMEYARGLSTLMTAYALENGLVNGTELVIPVPMHKDKLKKRGFNQAELLAKYLASDLRLEYSPKILERIKKTKTQSALSPAERRANMKGSMSVTNAVGRKLIQDKTVLLVDDIFTTGSTADACAEELLSAGAKEVISFTLAVVFH